MSTDLSYAERQAQWQARCQELKAAVEQALDLAKITAWVDTKSPDDTAGKCSDPNACVIAQYLLETIPGACVTSVGTGDDPDDPQDEEGSRGSARVYTDDASTTVPLPIELDRLAHRFDDLPDYDTNEQVPARVVQKLVATLDQPKSYPAKRRQSDDWDDDGDDLDTYLDDDDEEDDDDDDF